jgi:NADH:ubiquinone oxidoreductase subunit D
MMYVVIERELILDFFEAVPAAAVVNYFRFGGVAATA